MSRLPRIKVNENLARFRTIAIGEKIQMTMQPYIHGFESTKKMLSHVTLNVLIKNMTFPIVKVNYVKDTITSKQNRPFFPIAHSTIREYEKSFVARPASINLPVQ